MKYTNTKAAYADGDESGQWTMPESKMNLVFEVAAPNDALNIESYYDLSDDAFEVEIKSGSVDERGEIHEARDYERPFVVCRDEATATAITNALNAAPNAFEAVPDLLEALELAAATFENYALIHSAKDNEIAWGKANSNSNMALQMRAVIAKAKEVSQ